MQIVDNSSPKSSQASYTVQADDNEIKHAREAVLKQLSRTIKVPGFREGKVPLEIVEKNTPQANVQSEVANHVINDLYNASIGQMNIIPVGQPKITLSKFVPYSTLEFKVEVEIISNLKLGNYKSIKVKFNSTAVSDEQQKTMLKELQNRSATYTDVKRSAAKGDRLNIDFEGSDTGTNQKLDKASAEDYLLILGSNTFIPGFENKLIGKKAGEEVNFDLEFPKDYFDNEYKGRKVHFKVKINSVGEPKLPKIDDEFASKLGPFKTLDELKTQLKNELQRENDRQARIEQDNAILEKIAEVIEADLTDILIDEEVESIRSYDQRTALNNGLTWSEFLKKEKLTEAEYDKKIKPAAIRRLKIGLAIIEIAKQENITVTDEELNEQISLLKKQYTDPKMQEELNSDAVKNDLTKRILTQKVIDHIKNISS